MRSNHSNEENVRPSAIDFFDITPSPISQNPYEISLRKNYPDVDEPYQFMWDRSDTTLPRNEEWLQKLNAASMVLERASEICKKLAQQPSRMTPSALTKISNTLREADHKLVEIISDLMYKYPMADTRHYSSSKNISGASGSLPKLIFLNDNEFVLWILTLPQRGKHAHNSLIIKEAEDLLYSSQLPHLRKWHCDFIHVYHPDYPGGVRDVDNYFSKPIIDAITMAMHAKDSYDNYSASQYNFPSKMLAPGYYFRVYENNQKVRKFQEFEERVKAAQGG